MAIDSDMVTSRHCLIPEGFSSPFTAVTRRRCASWDAYQTKRIRRKEGDNLARECFVAALIWRGLTTAMRSSRRSSAKSNSCTFEETHQRTEDHGNPLPNEAFETISDC